jgi:predicted nucleic acid-binding protein
MCKEKLRCRDVPLGDIIGIGIHILPVDAQGILAAGDLGLQHGLLSGDALLVAIMQRRA